MGPLASTVENVIVVEALARILKLLLTRDDEPSVVQVAVPTATDCAVLELSV